MQKKAGEDQLLDVVEDLDEDMQDHREEVVRMIRIGVWCLQNDYTMPLMSTVVKALQGDMEVPSIISKFCYAMASSFTASDHLISVPPEDLLFLLEDEKQAKIIWRMLKFPFIISCWTKIRKS